MSRYTGFLCASCEQPFNQNDDIVVCPDCGAPHHRNCYTALGHCAFKDKHGNGFAWQDERPKSGSENGAVAIPCPSCNSVNPLGSQNCQMCGSTLKATDSYAHSHAEARAHGRYEPNSHTAPPAADEWSVEGVTAKELTAYTGDKAFYFLRQFQLIIDNKYHLSWNWSALLFNFFYFFYRKMYKAGFALLIFFIVSYVPAFMIYFGPTDATAEMLGVAIRYNSQLFAQVTPFLTFFYFARMFVSVWCAIRANKVYFETALTEIIRQQKSTEEPSGSQQYYELLYRKGRPNRLIVAVLLLCFLAFHILFIEFITWEIL